MLLLISHPVPSNTSGSPMELICLKSELSLLLTSQPVPFNHPCQAPGCSCKPSSCTEKFSVLYSIFIFLFIEQRQVKYITLNEFITVSLYVQRPERLSKGCNYLHVTFTAIEVTTMVTHGILGVFWYFLLLLFRPLLCLWHFRYSPRC